jgi:two-component system, chemotaxis family, chemotaxis protein CheY
MKSLVVEDDLTSRLLLETVLAPYGECQVAVNGKEALKAFRAAKAGGRQYDLICLDIMMPEMDGQEVIQQIRTLEEADGIMAGRGVKVIMTTALADPKNVMKSHYQICQAYMIKPIDKAVLLDHLMAFGLI